MAWAPTGSRELTADDAGSWHRRSLIREFSYLEPVAGSDPRRCLVRPDAGSMAKLQKTGNPSAVMPGTSYAEGPLKT